MISDWLMRLVRSFVRFLEEIVHDFSPSNPAHRAAEILADVDLQIMRDITCPNDCADCADERDHMPALQVCYVGWPQESISPIFEEHGLLVEWVVRNEFSLRAWAEALSAGDKDEAAELEHLLLFSEQPAESGD